MPTKQNGFSSFFMVVITLIMFACAGINYPIHKSPRDDHFINEYSFKEKIDVSLKDMFEKPIYMIDSGLIFSTPNNKIVKIVPHIESWQIIND